MVVSQYGICHSYKTYAIVFTLKKFIVHWTNNEGKSYVGMLSCVKVLLLQLLLRISQRKSLNNVT